MKKNVKGFTLAELLIVVAIIAVLVGISIPVFTSQLEKAREGVDAANIRAQYSKVMLLALEKESDVNIDGGDFGKIELSQTKPDWNTENIVSSLLSLGIIDGAPTKNGYSWVEYDFDAKLVTIKFSNDGVVDEVENQEYATWVSDILDKIDDSTQTGKNDKIVLSTVPLAYKEVIKMYNSLSDDQKKTPIGYWVRPSSDGIFTIEYTIDKQIYNLTGSTTMLNQKYDNGYLITFDKDGNIGTSLFFDGNNLKSQVSRIYFKYGHKEFYGFTLDKDR